MTPAAETIRAPKLRMSYDDLKTSVQFVKGVGPQRSELLFKIGVKTIEDLLFYLPRDHQDRRFVPIRTLQPGQKAAVTGSVIHADFKQVGKSLGQLRATIQDATGTIAVVWFKRLSYQYDVFSSLKKHVQPGKQTMCYGVVDSGSYGLELKVEDYDEPLPGFEPLHTNRIVPIYPLTEGISDRWLRTIIHRTVGQYAASVPDSLPASLRTLHELMPLNTALRQYHFPANWAERDRARHTLAFEEFFVLELALALNRQNRTHQNKGFVSEPSRRLLSPFKNRLEYEFTKAQIRAINEIFRDMAQPVPMNRLLQGDVGSGKTVVALSASLLALENQRQVAFLAPTEVLATQHALSLEKFFKGLPINWSILTGATPPAERRKILRGLHQGSLHMIVGTHAILEETVLFKDLGLIVIDEQHRFGVRQREKLVNKARLSSNHTNTLETVHPDVLIMTATPIPRTLALTLYGDLDVSIIDEMPPGRQRIDTRLVNEEEAWSIVDAEIRNGRQAYVVFPLVEESDRVGRRSTVALRAATHEFHRLEQRFPGRKVGLLHGQMRSEKKQTMLNGFRRGEIEILVATPVIEVGIDVGNATVMVIVNPERFGLAQLHQLRGRVGRGKHPSQCLLVASTEAVPSERLVLFCALTDGFRLAEEDLKLRGPGEFLGEAQHGLPFFRVGNLVKDGLLIAQTREAAKQLVGGSVTMSMPEFTQLNRVLHNRFGNKLPLARIG